MPVRKRRQKGTRFSNFALYGSFSSDFVAVRGLCSYLPTSSTTKKHQLFNNASEASGRELDW